jgi:hypothetical protein
MAKYTLDTTLAQLMDDPQAKAVLDSYVPGLAANPMAAMIRPMSLNSVLAMPQAAQFGFTKDVAERLLAEVNKRV